MMRNLLILGCAALLAVGLSVSTFAGSIVDGDSDGVPDQFDNCDTVPNGPLSATGQCNGQEDANMDGYGQPCDADVNDDGGVGLDDVAILFALSNEVPPDDPLGDLNCDGGVGLDDVATGFAASNAVPPIVGPSGLACAGTIPCVAE